MEENIFEESGNVPDRILPPSISIARKVGRELSKWNDLFAAALHPGPTFANYKREPWRIPLPSGLSSLFPGENFVRSGSFSTETPYKITFFVQARSSFPCRWLQSITKTALSDVGVGRMGGGGGPFVTRLSSSYPRKSYLVPRFYLSLSLSLSLYSRLSLPSPPPRPPSPFSGELIGDGCGRCSIGN